MDYYGEDYGFWSSLYLAYLDLKYSLPPEELKGERFDRLCYANYEKALATRSPVPVIWKQKTTWRGRPFLSIRRLAGLSLGVMRAQEQTNDPPGTTEAVCREGLSGTGADRSRFELLLLKGTSCCEAGDGPDRL
ncbi:MAG: hypothetical protein B6241_14005 [Spirochaetaceae bacterium 4572_59]|nr:MAG: hypothetical protein B6241_14005 [Spirochaetaceae bacterium 4572_59]